jgi:hypothetical protein
MSKSKPRVVIDNEWDALFAETDRLMADMERVNAEAARAFEAAERALARLPRPRVAPNRLAKLRALSVDPGATPHEREAARRMIEKLNRGGTRNG